MWLRVVEGAVAIDGIHYLGTSKSLEVAIEGQRDDVIGQARHMAAA